jgi:CRP-like cAMP-binding protein
VSRQVLYVSGSSTLSKLFEQALNPLGYDELIYLPEFWRGMAELKKSEFGLIILHGPLPGLQIDDELVNSLREASEAPVFLLGWDEDDPAGGYEGFEIVPSPVTAAALTQAVARYRKPREENQLLSRLLAAPGFRTFSEAAMVHLLHGASAVQIQEEEVLFEEGAAGDAMYFVLAGSISLRLSETELETVDSGGIFGEMGMLENKPREARAVAAETSVLLEVHLDTLKVADHEFRAIFFELVSRVLVRRLRSTNSRLRSQ